MPAIPTCTGTTCVLVPLCTVTVLVAPTVVIALLGTATTALCVAVVTVVLPVSPSLIRGDGLLSETVTP